MASQGAKSKTKSKSTSKSSSGNGRRTSSKSSNGRSSSSKASSGRSSSSKASSGRSSSSKSSSSKSRSSSKASGSSNASGSSGKSSGKDLPRKPGDGQGPPSRRPDRKRSTPRSRPKYDDYAISDPRKIDDGPDVLVDVPVVKVDEIDFELDDLQAQVAVVASVRKMVQISVGADVRLGKVELKIEGVEAQASMVTLRVSGCREELPGGRLDGQTDLTIR
jgi:hypothetical protein